MDTFRMRNVVKVSENAFVLVDTRMVFGGEFETMAFPCNETGEKFDSLTELYFDSYFDQEEAEAGHKRALEIVKTLDIPEPDFGVEEDEHDKI